MNGNSDDTFGNQVEAANTTPLRVCLVILDVIRPSLTMSERLFVKSERDAF